METNTIPWPKVPSNLLRLSVIFQDLSRQVAGVITDGFEVGGFAPGTYFYHCTNGSCANIAEFSIENATCPLSLPDGSAEDVQGRAINFHSLPFFFFLLDNLAMFAKTGEIRTGMAGFSYQLTDIRPRVHKQSGRCL